MPQPNKESEHANFDYYAAHCPEGKIELVEGKLVVGNSPAGTRLLFDHILRGWTLDAATALGSIDSWMSALHEAYGPIESVEDEPGNWSAPDVKSGDRGKDGGHRAVRQHIDMSFFQVASELGGQALGRIVMQLGDDGFTPDTMFWKDAGRNTLYESHLEGPAEFVIEVALPAHRDYDFRIKRQSYARSGVPEYLIVDPEQHRFEFLRLIDGEYATQRLDADGCYRPASVPGLAIQPKHLWPQTPFAAPRAAQQPFIVERNQATSRRKPALKNELGWNSLPFEPKIDLIPVPVLFEEYICWSPEPKFEFWDGRIQISGEEGVRNILALILSTIGLVEACRYGPPERWLASLSRRRSMESRESEIRREWRQRVVVAAESLRAKYRPRRIAITGDLLKTDRLSFWSQPALAVWGVSFEQMQEIYRELSATNIDVFEGEARWFEERVSSGELTLENV